MDKGQSPFFNGTDPIRINPIVECSDENLAPLLGEETSQFPLFCPHPRVARTFVEKYLLDDVVKSPNDLPFKNSLKPTRDIHANRLRRIFLERGEGIMRAYATVFLLSTAMILGGCQSLGRTARIDPAGVTARPAPTGGDTCPLTTSLSGDAMFAIDLGCFKFQPRTKSISGNTEDEHKGDSQTAYQMATLGNDADVKKLARNRLEAVLVNHANLICEREKGGIYAKRAFSNALLDFLSSGFSISSTIVGGEQAKSILSGLAGLSTATRTNIDSNVYQNQLVPAITKVMDAERAKILTAMAAKRGSSVSEYSADEMIRMANEYHQACSFQKGVQLLLDAAVNKEGVDRIIEGINLRAALANLREHRDALDKLNTAEAQAKIKEIDTKIGDLTLKAAQNAEDAQGVTIQSE